MQTRNYNLKRMTDEIRQKEREREAYFIENYPVGSSITWLKNRRHGCQFGTVIHHGWNCRVKVENAVTKNQLWIELYDVLSAEQADAADSPAAHR